MTINAHLIEATNKQGYVVKTQHEWNPNQFGDTHIIVIEGGQYRISFVTNVLNGRNYFSIHQVTNYLTGRTYTSPRYHTKFISLIVEISGDVYKAMKGETK